MFSVKPFGGCPFGDEGRNDTRLIVHACAEEAITLTVITAIPILSSPSAIETMGCGYPATALQLSTVARGIDSVKCTWGSFFEVAAGAADAVSVTVTTRIPLATPVYAEGVFGVDVLSTAILLSSIGSAEDAVWVDFNLASHAEASEAIHASLTTTLLLGTEASTEDTVSVNITSSMLLVTSAYVADSLNLIRISAGVVIYPTLNRYAYHIEHRDYAFTSDVRDYVEAISPREYSGVLTPKDYNIFHDSEGSAMTIKTLSPKDPGETVPIKFYFDNMVDAIDTVDAVGITLASGVTDPGIATMVSGTPIISDALVVQLVSGGLAGNAYKLRCTIHKGNEIYVASAILPVETE